MGLLDFLFAESIVHNLKKTKHNDSQPMQNHDHGYVSSHEESSYDPGCHDDYGSSDTYSGSGSDTYCGGGGDGYDW